MGEKFKKGLPLCSAEIRPQQVGFDSPSFGGPGDIGSRGERGPLFRSLRKQRGVGFEFLKGEFAVIEQNPVDRHHRSIVDTHSPRFGFETHQGGEKIPLPAASEIDPKIESLQQGHIRTLDPFVFLQHLSKAETQLPGVAPVAVRPCKISHRKCPFSGRIRVGKNSGGIGGPFDRVEASKLIEEKGSERRCKRKGSALPDLERQTGFRVFSRVEKANHGSSSRGRIGGGQSAAQGIEGTL
jgi:hypothetical protein